jgi:hypothetical protein
VIAIILMHFITLSYSGQMEMRVRGGEVWGGMWCVRCDAIVLNNNDDIKRQ